MRGPVADRDISFSLVLATVGRTEELSNFLLHLEAQSYRQFQLIVVDQNPDDRLVPLLNDYAQHLPIQHCRSSRGLSRARNVGLKRVGGNVIAFPDDDCWYPSDLLQRVAHVLAEHPELDGVTGRPIDSSFSRFHKTSGEINKENVFLRSSSFTIFLRKSVVDAVGEFDLDLGLGSASGRIAGEETDYLLRAMNDGFRLHFDAGIEIVHQQGTVVYDANFNKKARGYNTALGYLLRKYDYPSGYVAKTWVRAFGGMCVSAVTLNLPKMKYHANVLLGRMLGYWQYR